jgi:hypothetical protein
LFNPSTHISGFLNTFSNNQDAYLGVLPDAGFMTMTMQ